MKTERKTPRRAASPISVAADSYVDRAYEQLKEAAINFGFKPGERLNEIDLAKRIGISRTPLREALHRLNTEGFLKFIPGKGFFCRDLDPKEIFDLYELRKVIELGALRLAAGRAKREELEALEQIQDEINAAAAEASVAKLLRQDELFHERLVALAGNAEMLRVLRNINARIRFVRVVDSDWAKHAKRNRQHRSVIKMLQQGDGEGCASILEEHIDLRLDQIMHAVKEGIARIYMPQPSADLPERVIRTGTDRRA